MVPAAGHFWAWQGMKLSDIDDLKCKWQRKRLDKVTAKATGSKIADAQSNKHGILSVAIFTDAAVWVKFDKILHKVSKTPHNWFRSPVTTL